jgi:lipid-binding SYLF domain-containing protein
VKLGVQAELSLGPFGRAANIDLNLSSRGAGSTVSVAFSKGVFGALSARRVVLLVRDMQPTTLFSARFLTMKQTMFIFSVGQRRT